LRPPRRRARRRPDPRTGSSLPHRLQCLHGFLGQPEDFAPLAAALAVAHPTLAVAPLPLWPDTALPLAAWATRHRAAARPGDVLLGYSMGGRLALTSFLHPDSPHAALIAVAAHPGGLDANARAARLAHDRRWAERFLAAPWAPLVADWNAQAVFAGRTPPNPRPEALADRPALAAALTHWSVAHQPDLRPLLAAERRPVLWVVGADDPRYTALAATLPRDNPQQRILVLPGAAHRVPWEAPDAFAAAVAAFLATLPTIQTHM